MGVQTFISAPASALRFQSFFQQHPVEDFTAVTFFKFFKFQYYERQSASHEYKDKVYNRAMSMCNAKVTAAMVHDWNSNKRIRLEYWSQLKSIEEKEKKLQRHIGTLESDVMERSEIVSGALTRKIATQIESSTTSMSSAQTEVSVLTSSFTPSASNITTKSFPKKRQAKILGPSLQAPWNALMEVALALHLGKNVELPPLPDLSQLSDSRKGLYQCAYNNLSKFKTDKKQVICKKEAAVALSCTLDMSNEDLGNYFDEKFIVLASGAYELQLPASRTKHIVEPLAEILELHDVKFLLKKVRVLKGAYTQMENRGENVPSLWEPVLDVVEYLCKLILRPPYGEMSPSEGDVVSEWKSIFNILLEGTNVFMRSGECVSSSSKDIKVILDEEYDDFGTFGRKVDLSFQAYGLELANCEFKTASASDLDIELQNKKNIRLNRAIMESHKSTCGVRLNMLYMDIQGWNGSLFSLHTYEDVFVSKFIRTIKLPTSKLGMKRFLSGDDLDAILVFVDHLRKLGDDLKDYKEDQEEQRASKRHQHLFDRTSSPSPKERRISGNVFLSPTVSRKKVQK